MSEKTLKFHNSRVNKKEFHKSKQPIYLGLVKVDQIVVSDKFKCSDDGFKYFIGYKEGEIVKPLRSILPQMTGFFFFFFLKFGNTPCRAEQPLQDMELQEKETQKD